MTTQTALLLAAAGLVGVYVYARRDAIAGSGGGTGPVTVYPTANKPASAMDKIIGINQKADQVAVTGVCTYYTGGSGAPACAAAGRVVSEFNAWQTRQVVKGAKAVGNAAESVWHAVTPW